MKRYASSFKFASVQRTTAAPPREPRAEPTSAKQRRRAQVAR